MRVSISDQEQTTQRDHVEHCCQALLKIKHAYLSELHQEGCRKAQHDRIDGLIGPVREQGVSQLGNRGKAEGEPDVDKQVLTCMCSVEATPGEIDDQADTDDDRTCRPDRHLNERLVKTSWR